MNQDIRRELISKNLGIKPINHGQIYTFQIALPDPKKSSLSLERQRVIEQSLLEHQSNLVSLIVRRTDTYPDDDIEYELVYGADWLQIAQTLDIEKVWAWVFDMTDEQAIALATQMESLILSSTTSELQDELISSVENHESNEQFSDSVRQIDQRIDHKLQLATDSIKQSIIATLNTIKSDLDEKLKIIHYRIDNFNSTSHNSSSIELILEKLESLQHQLTSSRKSTKTEFTGEPINLREASDEAIATALKQVGAQDAHIQGALAAIQFWQQPDRGLTWENLARSARAKTGSQYKINEFGKGTYDRLAKVATIPEE
jgi:hypothetical protein